MGFEFYLAIGFCLDIGLYFFYCVDIIYYIIKVRHRSRGCTKLQKFFLEFLKNKYNFLYLSFSPIISKLIKILTLLQSKLFIQSSYYYNLYVDKFFNLITIQTLYLILFLFKLYYYVKKKKIKKQQQHSTRKNKKQQQLSKKKGQV